MSTHPITPGTKVPLVSIEDQEVLAGKRWVRHPKGCFQRIVNGKTQKLHRVIMERALERSLSPHEYIDHINRNKADNRRDNLRLSNAQDNAKNRGLHGRNTSGYIGVYWNRNHWCWEICLNGNRTAKHSFKSPRDAAESRDRFILQIGMQHLCTLSVPEHDARNKQEIPA